MQDERRVILPGEATPQERARAEVDAAAAEGVTPSQTLLETAYHREASGAIRASTEIARADATKVYLWVRELGVYIEADLFDRLHVASGGQVPPELHIICPFCGGQSVIPPSHDPTQKHVSVERLSTPRQLVMPDDGEVVYQLARVTVEEECTCGHPDPAGKGVCGWRFKVTENVISRV